MSGQSRSMTQKRLDVALHVVNHNSVAESLHEVAVTFEKAVLVAPQLWLGRLEHRIAKAVFDTCRSRTYSGAGHDARVWRQAFVWEGAAWNDSEWDSAGRMREAIAISRLVSPTSIGFEFAAVIELRDGVVTEVSPADTALGRQGYPAEESISGSLSVDNAVELANLLHSLRSRHHPQRVSRALHMNELMNWTDDPCARWPLLCSALESFVHTRRLGSTKQFVNRTVQLARLTTDTALTAEEAAQVYELRSSIVHGQGFRGVALPSDGALYQRCERVLRGVVKRALQDADFERHFADSAAIEQFLPL